VPRRGSQPASAGADLQRRRASRAGNAELPPVDLGTALGIPGLADDSLTPELRASITRVLGERDRLRDDLARARSRITSLERLADEDSLTPVANRRAFVRALTRMIAFAHRYGVPASVVYFDVNNMKHINDEHGHPAGDAALRHVAGILRDNIRSSDVVGRLGGDEFGVILAQTDEAQAQDKASVLAEAITATPLTWDGIAINVSAAYGIYAFTGRDDPQHAIEAADRAMYLHKRATAHTSN
jgi:diguanylate cyclase (GGDEF)-like protein